MKNIKTVLRKYFDIETAQDLKKNKLTLSEHYELYDVLREVSERKEAKCFMNGVAAWCRRNGLTVVDPHDHEINYTISI